MQEITEKLLVLQDRDRKILRVNQELAHIGPDRDNLRGRAASTQSQLEAAKLRVKQIESERKQRDLEIEGKKSQIEKYLNQQLLTRKNEEYKALTHEIEMAKEVIFKIEDAQIVLMEQAEAAQKEVARAAAEAAAAKKLLDDQIGQLDEREANVKKDFASLTAERAQLASAVDEATRSRYERIFKSKGENVVVGVEHSACGGCHMKLPAQVMTHCRAQTAEIVTCPSCGRILYFKPDMDLKAGD
jgi:predicted  nucleic acid-binding Zn-ribbon protein